MDTGEDWFSDEAVGTLLALARSANVYIDLVDGRVVVRAVQPRWRMWHPVRFLLDEVGLDRIEAYLMAAPIRGGVEPGDVTPPPVTREAMLRWSAARRR